MKKYVAGLMFLALILLPIHALSDNMIGKKIEVEVPVKLNGEYLNVNAIGVNGTTYLPVRAAFEAVGADVKWDDAAREVVINLDLSDQQEDPSTNDVEGGEVLEIEVEEEIIDEDEILARISEIEKLIEKTKNANMITQKVIDMDLEVLTEEVLTIEEKEKIGLRIKEARDILAKNYAIINELEAEKERLLELLTE